MGSEMSPSQKISAWLREFDTALQKEEKDQVMELFADPECFWRDLLAFTWNIQTFESRVEIAPMLKENLSRVKPTHWEIDGPAYEKPMMIGAGIKFETSFAWGRGFLWLQGGKCWTMLTAMWELKGHEEKIARSRTMGTPVSSIIGRKSWLQEQQEEQQALGHTKQPYCLIVGGGQAGVMLGARLRVLGVPTIIVERNARAGDNWRNRYKSLALHTPFFGDYFPYLPYPNNWPIFPPKDKVGDWIDCYTKLMELNYWTSTECKSASFDEKAGRWDVVVQKKSGEEVSEVVLHPTQLVYACGLTGFAKTPTIKGAESFEGAQLHSSQYKRGEDWKGKKCVVVGAATSAHDICLDLWEQGASEITMVQKSESMVIKIQTFLASRVDPDLKDTEFSPGFDVESSDIKDASLPYKVLPRAIIPVYARIAEQQAEFHNSLRKAGFKLHLGEDGSGLPLSLLRRAGGYYIDVGASELIANGTVKVKSGVTVEEIKPKSVVFSDGTELSADVIVYATGYGNMVEIIEGLISKQVGEKIGLCWGLGSNTKNDPGPWEGELRNMWKPLAVSNFWITSGGFSQCRFYSRPLALQLKAKMEGIPTPVYTLQKSVS